MGGHGFQEQFFLWEKYAKKYSLDYILIGPRCFQPNRDLTFGKPMNFERPIAGVKNRFILSEGNPPLKEVFLKGRTMEEKHRKYYQFIPSRTALLYDTHPFEAWETTFPFLRGKISNPFYYRKITEIEEAVAINTLLLEKIKKLYDNRILFFTDDPFIFHQYHFNRQLYNLNFIPFPKNRLYKNFAHKSSLGNEFIAIFFFNALIGKKDFFIKTINCHYTSNGGIHESFNKNLYDVQSIWITDDSQKTLSELRQNSSDHHYKEGTYKKHKLKGTKSFVSFLSSFSSSFLESPFFPVSIQLKENMKIYVQFKDGVRMKLGKIEALDSYKKFFIFRQKYMDSMFDGYVHNFSYLLINQMPSLMKKKMKNTNGYLRIFVENHKLGTLHRESHPHKEEEDVFKFIPNQDYKKSFLMMGFNHVREKDVSDEFLTYFQYNMKNGEKMKSPIHNWKCKKEIQKTHLDLPNFKPLRI